MGVKIQIAGDFNPRAFDQASARLDALRRNAVKNSGTIDGALMRSGGNLEKWGGKLQGVGKSMTRNVTLPLLAIGGLAFNVAAEFETTMNMMEAATGAPAAQMEQLSELAIKMGADTIFSANEAAGAMLELAKAGLEPAQIQAGALAAALDLAAAGGIGLEAAATTAANAMNMFGLEAEDAQEIANAFAGGANKSSADVESLTQALSQVGPGARNAGLSLQDTVGVLAAFADKGIQGSDAGTSLKTMLQRLVPQTDKAADAMDKYNLVFVDSKGNFDDIETVAGKLQKRLGGLAEAERANALQMIFGSDATRAATVLMDNGEKGIRDYIRATQDQTAASSMAEARMKGVAGAIEQMKGSVETAALLIGQSLAPTVTRIAGQIQGLANDFAGLSPEMQEGIVKLGLFAMAMGPVITVASRLTIVIGGLTKAFGAGGFASKLGALAAPGGVIGLAVLALYGLAEGIGYVTEHQDEWGRAQGAVTWSSTQLTYAIDDQKRAIDALNGILTAQPDLNMRVEQASINLARAEERLKQVRDDENASTTDLRQAELDRSRALKENEEVMKEAEAAEKAKTVAGAEAAHATMIAHQEQRTLNEKIARFNDLQGDVVTSCRDAGGAMETLNPVVEGHRKKVGAMSDKYADLAAGVWSVVTGWGQMTPGMGGNISGLADGGFFPGSRTRVVAVGDGSSDEVIQPLDDRQQSRDLLAYSMQRMGVFASSGTPVPSGMPTTGTAGRSVTIMPGAIQIVLPEGSPAETQRAAGKGVLDALARELSLT